MYTKPHLLIIDEIGYRKMEDEAAHFFFHIVSERYEKGSILFSNKSYPVRLIVKGRVTGLKRKRKPDSLNSINKTSKENNI
ncbi:MAG: Mobile element protein [Candidatus Carbobacillus altaicus]|uniref:Mobile element protein n=1 Tax=Candidatus Carbonibacillus altaicus TaxID=2163959 RepID=A0A2R6XYG3_9BACL|nr:MAG: Mobile element protein [Candidatus Carbobacillus altaicus]